MDKWAQEVFGVFMSVLKRPRFEVAVHEEGYNTNFGYYSCEFTHSGTTYHMKVTSSAKFVELNTRELPPARFHFNLLIPKAKPMKLRQQALIMMVKMENKPMYDVFNT